MSITIIETGLDFGSDYLTDAAIAKLVGQRPRLTADFDHRKVPIGRSKIIAAERRGKTVVATLEVEPEAAAAAFPVDDHRGYSLASPGGRVLERIDGPRFGIVDANDVEVHQIAPAQAFGNPPTCDR